LKAARDSWRVRLTAAAETDFNRILRETAERFGERQATHYAETLLAALDALHQGPRAPGARPRDELAKGVFTLHVARAGRRARHLVVFRIEPGHGGKFVQVLRILHDAMDLPRHVKTGESGDS
jgi:toxin ParE1/3/4